MSTVLFLYTLAVLKMNTIFCLSCKNKKISERKIGRKKPIRGVFRFCSGQLAEKLCFFGKLSTDFYIRKKADAHAGV